MTTSAIVPDYARRMIVATVRAVFAIYLAGLAWIVWAPSSEAGQVTGMLAVIAEWLEQFGLAFTPTWTVLEVLANVALFIPFGALVLTVFRTSVSSATLAGLALSALVETVQLFLPTRVPAVSDLIANTAGTFVGALLISAAASRLSSRRSSPPPQSGTGTGSASAAAGS